MKNGELDDTSTLRKLLKRKREAEARKKKKAGA